MEENKTAIMNVLYKKFMDSLGKLEEDIDNGGSECECIKYGLDCIKESEFKSQYSAYALMWTGFYLGAGVGIEIAETILDQ